MKPTLQMTEFDELIGSGSLQMMKAFIPFLEPSMQQWAAFYIQLQELTNAIELFQTPGKPPPWPHRSMPPPEQLIETLRPYGGPAESAMLDQMKNAMEAMKLYQKFADLQKKASGPLSPTDLIKEMLPPEQAAMFETYSTMFQGMDFMDMGMAQAFSQSQGDKEE
ncbi:MAG: hypothetical protein HFI39_09830 [Lachnospiraceae bacterium]|nr:hypothetical protein [Lachnospiraceae bacterium]